MSRKPLRAGIVGLGMMGRNHARILQALDGVELVAAADEQGDRFDVLRSDVLVRSLDEALSRGLDLCVVATPTDEHASVALRLAEAGVHMLIEKPVASSVAEAELVVQAVSRAGVIACVGHVERFNPALVALRRRLEDEELGEIYQVATSRQGPFPDRIRDVGVVKDLATHDLDLTAWVADSPYANVSARATHKAGRAHEDLVVISGALRNGVLTNHLVNWLSPQKDRRTVVTGERGTFVADTLQADLFFHVNGSVDTSWDAVAAFRGVVEGDVVRFAIPKPEPLRSELEAFRDAVRGQRGVAVGLDEGLQALVVAEAALASAATGGSVVECITS